MSSLVERAGAEADAAFRALLDLAEQGTVATPDIRERLRILASQGIEAVGDLAVAAEGLEAEAAGHAARAGRGAPVAAVGELGWMMALYTMEDERRVHRAAIASAGGAG